MPYDPHLDEAGYCLFLAMRQLSYAITEIGKTNQTAIGEEIMRVLKEINDICNMIIQTP